MKTQDQIETMIATIRERLRRRSKGKSLSEIECIRSDNLYDLAKIQALTWVLHESGLGGEYNV